MQALLTLTAYARNQIKVANYEFACSTHNNKITSFQVHIRISSYQCGGVLLNHLYVATAAHCVHQAKLSQITVHLGEYDTKNTQKVRYEKALIFPNTFF